MSWGVALRNAVGLGLGGIPSLLNAPPYAKLAFNFLSGVLDPRITFSRTSNATLIGSDGTLQYAPHNLLTYSEQFDNAAWGKTNASVTSNSIAAPDGTTTGDTVIRSTGVAAFIGNSSGAGAARQCTMSLYAKAATAGNGVGLRIQGTFPNRGDVVFNLTNGTISSPAVAAGTATGASATITSAGGGWYRCTLTVTLADSLTICVFSPCETTAPAASFEAASAVASNCYSWGAQLNVGALQPYYSTTVKNLLGYSQEFNNAAWSKTNSTITADVTAAPDGSVTADKLVEDTSAAIGHFISPVGAPALVVGQVFTYSVYAKAAERTFLQLILTSIGPAGANLIAGFDLTTGLVGTPSATSTSSMVAVGNGWYRCRITAPVATAGSPLRQIRISQNASSTPSSYTGDGTSGIFIWGAQFSDSASLDPYVYNPAAAPSNTAYYGPRFDYNPTTLAPLGLLIEEQRTNSIRNNTMVGAIAGTPGTAPTNWVVPGPINGLTQEIVGIGSENGVTYIDVKFSGTTSAASSHVISFEAANQIAAASGQTWNRSAWFKIVAGSTANITALNFNLQGRNAANSAFTETFAIDIAPSLTSALTRITATATLADINTAFARSQIQYFYNSGVAVNITLRIGLPQLELGAFATSVIPTTTAAATRAADVASMTGANFSNWYNPVEGTLITTTLAINQTFPPNRYVSTMDDGTTNNIIGAYIATDLNAASFVVNGGVAVYQEIITTVSNTSPNSIAVTYKANNFMSAANGVLGIPDTSGAIPVVNKITFGNRSDGARPLNGHIRSFKYYPTRLRDSALQALTR